MKEKEFIIILNFSTGKVIIAEYNSCIVEDVQEFFEVMNEKHDLDLSESNCQWMITKEQLPITIL